MITQTIIPPTAPFVPILPYANFWRRFIAWGIDRTIIDMSFMLLTVPLLMGSIMGNMMAFPFMMPFGGLGLTGAWVLVDWLYFASFESTESGATLGKKFVGVRVTDMKAKQISFRHATLRYFSKYLSALPMMLGYVLAVFTQKRQALHDLIAETVVIRTR